MAEKTEQEIMEEKDQEENEGVGESIDTPDEAETAEEEQITSLAADEEVDE
ncbi:hypothetical protein [Salinicoccus albus]|uniref:hypothetical protein n=1 Tax=Salinicoccus albus TaxID=418756 RepID=UPI000367264A|nr:hypothetical protein [Salinicoccus albus]